MLRASSQLSWTKVSVPHGVLPRISATFQTKPGTLVDWFKGQMRTISLPPSITPGSSLLFVLESIKLRWMHRLLQ